MKTISLRHIASIQNSNVDKHTVEDEQPVRLCNYVDVYKNDVVTANIDFMQVTAKESEIEKFRLCIGDVIITKDSEDRFDIGVPAYVDYEAADLLCGYHLAILKPRDGITIGKFLFWTLQSRQVRDAFSLAANGVTRFGLTLDGIKSVPIPYAEVSLQTKIADFLDRETSRIDRLIEMKRKQIFLTREHVEQDCLQLLTCGQADQHDLVSDPRFDWITLRPRDWEPIKLKWFFRENTDYSKDGKETLFSLRMKEGLVPHNDVSDKPIPPEDLIGYKRVQPGEVVMNRMRAAIGLFGLATSPGIVSPDYSIFTVLDKAYAPYFLRLFKTEPMMSAFRLLSKGLGNGSQGFMRLNADRFGSIKVAVPSYEEQVQISELIEKKIERASILISSIYKSIDLLLEKRSALITAAVTGQLDVTSSASVLASANDNVPLLVAAEIIRKHERLQKFGRVKFQKIVYLAEAHCGVNEFSGKYQREAAGPLDRVLLNNLEDQLAETGLYRAEQTKDGGAVTYKTMGSGDDKRDVLTRALGDRADCFRDMLDKLRDMDTHAVEAITTLYAVWNDFLIDGEAPDDRATIKGVIEDWHPEKKDKFRIDELQTWLGWMRRNDFIPKGQGPRTTTGRLFV